MYSFVDWSLHILSLGKEKGSIEQDLNFKKSRQVTNI